MTNFYFCVYNLSMVDTKYRFGKVTNRFDVFNDIYSDLDVTDLVNTKRFRKKLRLRVFTDLSLAKNLYIGVSRTIPETGLFNDIIHFTFRFVARYDDEIYVSKYNVKVRFSPTPKDVDKYVDSGYSYNRKIIFRNLEFSTPLEFAAHILDEMGFKVEMEDGYKKYSSKSITVGKGG